MSLSRPADAGSVFPLRSRRRFQHVIRSLAIGTVILAAGSANAASEAAIHIFKNPADGIHPLAVVSDSSGNLFGVSGENDNVDERYSYTQVFELRPPKVPGSGWNKTAIYHFRSAAGQPTAALTGVLTIDGQGNLWGISREFGANGAGYIFELTPPADKNGTWTSRTIYDFPQRFIGNGYGSYGRIFFDPNGNIVGLAGTSGYGAFFGCPNNVCGIIYSLAPPTTPGAGVQWTETDLLQITGDAHQYPTTMIPGPAGTYVGTSYEGGTIGTGIVWQASPPKKAGKPWTYKVIYNFCQTRNAGDGYCTDGKGPVGGLALDSHNNIFGTTKYDGPAGNDGHGNAISSIGTVFRLSKTGATWSYALLHAFIQYKNANGHGIAEAQQPNSALTIDGAGNLFGTTADGGPTPLDFDPAGPAGCVYELVRGSWNEKILHIFPNTNTTHKDGAGPDSDVVRGPDGALYGTTYVGGVPVTFTGTADGGSGEGVVYQIAP